jgi:hypothetical protein
MRDSGRWLVVVVLGGIVVAGGCGSSTNNGGSGGGGGGRGGSHGLGGRGGAGAAGGASPSHNGGASGGTAGSAGEAIGGAGAAGTSGGPGGAKGGAGSSGGAGVGEAGAGGAGTGGAGAGGAGVGGSAGSGCLVPAAPGAWTEIAARVGDAGMSITDSLALGPDDLLFAGTSAPGASGNQLRVVHWSHGCWNQEVSMPIDATATRASVHGLGASDLWAVGGDLILHDAGQGWMPLDEGWRSKIQLTPRKSDAPALPTFVRVRAAGASDVWINEVENIVHWTAGSWTAYNFDSPTYSQSGVAFDFTDVWIDGPNDVWVAGGSDVVGDTYDPAYLRQFDGASWTPFTPAVYNILSIWRSGATLWMATVLQPPPGGSLVPFITGATTFPTPVSIAGVPATSEPPFLETLWGRADNDIWSAGSDVAHFDGASWSLETDIPSAARSATGDGTNTFVGGDPNAVWLVTPGPRFFRKPFGP